MVDAQFNFNLFDGIVFTVLFVSAAISLFRGFIREFLSLATWIGAGLVTLAIVDNVIAGLTDYFTSAMAAAIVGTLGTYFVVLLIMGSLSRLLVRYVRDGTEVGWVDNVMGLGFGFIKGGLVIVLGFILMTLVFREDGYPDWVQNAATMPAVKEASIKVVRMMPEYLGSISMLDSQPEDAALAEAPPVDESAEIEAGLQQELLPKQLLDQAKEQQDSGALEQLIRDVTAKSEDAATISAEEAMPVW